VVLKRRKGRHLGASKRERKVSGTEWIGGEQKGGALLQEEGKKERGEKRHIPIFRDVCNKERGKTMRDGFRRTGIRRSRGLSRSRNSLLSKN